jgi:hypothetical protein
MSIDGADAQALEGALAMTERERDTARAESAALRAEVDHLRDREATIIKAVKPVADGGQYRADIVSAIARVTAERDALKAEVEAMRAVESDARRVVDHWRDGLGMIGPVTSLRSDLDALDALRTHKGGG